MGHQDIDNYLVVYRSIIQGCPRFFFKNPKGLSCQDILVHCLHLCPCGKVMNLDYTIDKGDKYKQRLLRNGIKDWNIKEIFSCYQTFLFGSLF